MKKLIDMKNYSKLLERNLDDFYSNLSIEQKQIEESLRKISYNSDIVDVRIGAAVENKLLFLREEISPDRAEELLEGFCSFLCLDTIFEYNYGYLTDKIVLFEKYLSSLRDRFESIWSHFKVLTSLRCRKFEDYMFVYDESYCFSVSHGTIEISIIPKGFVALNKSEKDKYILEIYHKNDKHSILHGEKLAEFVMTYLPSFYLTKDFLYNAYKEKLILADMSKLLDDMMILLGE